MEKALKITFYLGPLIFAFGFLMPLICLLYTSDAADD